MTPVDLRALLAAATPRPWEVAHSEQIVVFRVGSREVDAFVADTGPEDEPESFADAALIVAAVNSLPHLLDRLEKIEELAWDTTRLLPSRERHAVRKKLAALSALDEQEPPPCKECGGPTVFYDVTLSRRLFKCEACSTPENYRWTTVPRDEQEPR